jgi:hypothetical protein
VYDLGGGTFDSAVLRASGGGGFEIVGRPEGDDEIGGELFDEIVANAIGEQLDAGTWERIQLGQSRDDRQLAVVLRAQARRAKETLSSYPTAWLHLPFPGGLAQQTITRDTLERLVAPYIEATIDTLGRSIEAAGITASQLAAIQLAGGMSRMPLVERMLREAFPDVPVHRRGDPKVAVAMGALVAPETALHRVGHGDTPASGDRSGPTPRPAGTDPVPFTTVPLVHTPPLPAVRCGDGHPNPVGLARCRVCGRPLDAGAVEAIERPVLGTLVFSSGERVPVDAPMLIGRGPRRTEGQRPDLRLVTVASPERGVSRNHLEVIIDGWTVQVMDLDSANGTTVALPGRAPVSVPAGHPVAIVPGTTVSLGDEAFFTFRAE